MARTTGTTTQRGYGSTHQAERRKWKPIVDAGQAHCHAAVCLQLTRRINPGEPWDLGHTPDRTAYTGPEHASCNRADGARRKNRRIRRPRITSGQRLMQPRTMQPSRQW